MKKNVKVCGYNFIWLTNHPLVLTALDKKFSSNKRSKTLSHMLKNDEKDNLGDTNKCYLTLHEVDSLLSENYKMGWKAGNFHSIKYEEQGREMENIWLAGAI